MNEQLKLTRPTKRQMAWPRHRSMNERTRQIGLAGVAEARALLDSHPRSRFERLVSPSESSPDRDDAAPDMQRAA
ncbi:MAG: hypothetical protein ISR43_08380 [Acidimicrobiia bacterium]|nr:hypothetical protein [Actinomycetota bacterium]MBL6925167.1 hypothetical protein [Acidimicrobiia bacterium]MBL6927229.1 hypothetical protein [Acidimicrobiia bacterium]